MKISKRYLRNIIREEAKKMSRPTSFKSETRHKIIDHRYGTTEPIQATRNLNENVNPELNPNQFFIDHPKMVELINLMGRPVTEFEERRPGTYKIEFKGGMRSGVNIARFQKNGIDIIFIGYDSGYIMMTVKV